MEDEDKIQDWLIYFYRENSSSYSNNSYEKDLLAIRCSKSNVRTISQNMQNSYSMSCRSDVPPYNNPWGYECKILFKPLDSGIFTSYEEFEETRKIKVEERLKELAETESYRYI